LSVLWLQQNQLLVLFTGTGLLCEMVQFESIFNDDKIIDYLCKLRVKVAKQRNQKHLLHVFTNNKKYNYHWPIVHKTDFEKQFAEDFYPLFPPRKLWKQLGSESRYKTVKGVTQKLSTVDKNKLALIKTINFYRKKDPNMPFVIRLNTFIKDIQESISNLSYNVEAPYTYPKAKDKKDAKILKADEYNICRPLSLFNLKDKLILSFTNNYLTKLFDNYFESCSLAFRATANPIVNHHTAIRNILEYKNEHTGIDLWVAECDMQKFFDTVDHKVITSQFESLISKAKVDHSHLNLEHCSNIFLSYLDCYCFNQNVLHKNKDSAHWIEFKIPKGQYGWIEKEINDLNLYKDISIERIGIPQGGALSGLIANIVLDIADKKLMENDLGAFYTRFCDDMVIMHPEEAVCKNQIKVYLDTLAACNLVVHPFSEQLKHERLSINQLLPPTSFKLFWKGKSKGPYKWGDVNTGAFPWIGFVGYEIHNTGDIRVRKSSLSKEIKKQKTTVKDIRSAIEKQLKVGRGTITESAMNKLIGMSVSRIELWNYKTNVSEMCWKNGFQELNVNKHSVKQMKKLDRHRNKLYYDLVKDMEDKVIEEKTGKIRKSKSSNRQIVSYDKPFSYYYHLIEKPK
jgi:hypothetical protein